MKIPLVDLKAQYAGIKQEIDEAIRRVVENTSFIQGKEVTDFEKLFSAYIGTAGTAGVASGTAALFLSLKALGIGSGDEVITTAHSFFATAEAISMTGAKPVFVDIDPRTYNIDPVKISAAVTARSKAIIPVHLYGYPADMGAIMELAGKHGLFVIEDAAQAHGAEYNGRRCGTFGHMACFSFYPGKNLGAYGDAGAVVSNDEELLRKVRKLRDHGRTTKYEHDEIGYGERLDGIHAAILAAKLPHLEEWTEARRRNADRYRKALAGMDVVLPFDDPAMRHVYHLFVIRVKNRDRVLDYLTAKGVGAGIHYPVPLHRQPAYLQQGYGDVTIPLAEAATAEIISLPLYPELQPGQIAYVAETLKEALTR